MAQDLEVIGVTKDWLILWINKIKGSGLGDIRSRWRVGMRDFVEIREIKYKSAHEIWDLYFPTCFRFASSDTFPFHYFSLSPFLEFRGLSLSGEREWSEEASKFGVHF